MTTVLFDTGPDLREQLLDAGVTRLDGVILTHAHADHTHGIDDVRPLVIHNRKRIDAWCDAETSEALHMRFGYVFNTPPGGSYPPFSTSRRFHEGREIVVDGPAAHQRRSHPHASRGYRCLRLPHRRRGLLQRRERLSGEQPPHLRGLDIWILDALRDTPHPTHFTVQEALDHIALLKPRRSILTNLHTDLDYAELAARLPEGVVPAYDMMQFEVAA